MKKPHSIQLSIPEPCTQAWDDMRPEQGGKYCAHCQKTVTDFTNMSDATLLAYVQRNGFGCGRFLDGQLERVIETPVIPRRNYWMQLAAGVAALVAFGKVEGV